MKKIDELYVIDNSLAGQWEMQDDLVFFTKEEATRYLNEFLPGEGFVITLEEKLKEVSFYYY